MLVEITGLDVDREGMIKMPLNLDTRGGSDWRETLRVALERLNALDAEARRFQGETGRYIRPILLVQAERTGAEQRGRRLHPCPGREGMAGHGGHGRARDRHQDRGHQ